MEAQRPLTVLDCTIRDGSYAIDFKFTAADTALIAGLLDEAGVPWIEVGHGLGLGASTAGKGTSGSDDREVVRLSRARVGRAKLGAFFIPGIGTLDDLRAAAADGLDFVRIGQNADAIETTFGVVEAARELGLDVFVNLMKTYGVSPADFAQAARGAEAVGARGIYVVDSAGGMMPHEVAAYVEASRAASELPVGFHGHSNLHLAVANSLAAFEAGAEFVDTSVYGIGRSSGNVPTEVLAAVCDRLGIDCGIDALQIIDLAETYLKPLAEHLHPHDMVAVSLGLGRFHSSFLTRAMKAAEEAGVNPFRVIVECGRRDVMELSDELLASVVSELADRPAPTVRTDLARFSDRRFGPRRIGNRAGAVAELLDGMEIAAAKRRLDVVLDLVSAPALDEEAVTAEFVIEDDHMALGRLRFGSPAALAESLAGTGARVDLLLLDVEHVAPDAVAGLLDDIAGAGGRPVLPYHGGRLVLDHLFDIAAATTAARGASAIVVRDTGTLAAADVAALERRLAALGPVSRQAETASADVLVVVTGPTDEPGEVGIDRDEAFRNRLPAWRGAVARAARQPGVQRVS